MGEITKEMPTAHGARHDLELLPSGGKKSEKPKSKAIHELGLSTSQVSRMEQVVTHPDIVGDAEPIGKVKISKVPPSILLKTLPACGKG